MKSYKRYLMPVLTILTVGGAAAPAQAEVECRWVNNRPVCQEAGSGTSDRYNRDRYDNNGRYNRDRNDRYDNNGRYNRDRNDRYDNNGRYNNSRYNNSSRSRIAREIEDLYRSVLGRSPDRRGLDDYVDRVSDRGWDLSRVRRDMAESNEAARAIDRLYREVLGRPADSRGLRTYQGRLRNGWDLSRVRQELADSNEARRRR